MPQAEALGALPLPVAGPGARCARQVARADAGDALRREVARWLAPVAPAEHLDALVLAQVVVHEVRWVGTSHLEPALLDDLAAVRDRHRGHDPMLDAFLDCVLAKHDGRYWNRTYLCLPVLERLVEGPDAPLDPIGLSALLAADVVRHELCASHRGKAVSPLDRPDGRLLRTRIRHATRFLTAALGGSATSELLAGVTADPEAGLPDILAGLPVAPAPWAAEWLALTVLQVSTVHDEAFFIRALQAHEMTYTAASSLVQSATEAVQGGRPEEAADLLAEVRALVDRGASLFRMIATLQSEAFHTFRDLTDGASAIQSEQYKRFEARCGTPPPSRLASAAYDSVPAVQAEVVAGATSLVEAWLAARRQRPADDALRLVGARMAEIEASHRRWKGTHLTLATRMLGNARGSGHTAGVPYLRSWVDHRLFWQAPELATLHATAAG